MALALQARNESHLIVLNNTFYMLLNVICYYLVENFCTPIHQGHWPVILLFFCVSVWFGSHRDGGFIKCVWKFSFHFHFLKQLGKDSYYLCFKCLLEIAREATWTRTLIYWEIFDN